jgi:putative nucleotidyltransferase with HDIG domain
MAERRIRLRAIEPEAKQKRWEAERRLRIGRLHTLELVFNDPSVSRRHAEVEFTGQGWIARDLGSTNGTFVNGVRLGRTDQPLHADDILQCGNLVLRVEALGEEPLDGSEAGQPGIRVQATARQSLPEAAERLVLAVTQSTRPGEQLLSLLRTGQSLDRFDCLDEFLARSLQDAAGSLRAQRGAAILFDEGTGKLRPLAVYPLGVDAAAGQCFSRTMAARCFRSGQSLLCADVDADPEMLGASSVRGTPMSSIICALLRTPRHHLGVLHLDRGPAADPFTPDDLHLADALAVNLSGAIESALQLQVRQRQIFIQTVIAFSQAIELRDPYTGGHAKRVTNYALLLAEEMALSEMDCYRLSIGAPLHDIGKIGIDDTILRKHEPLTPAEFEHMKSHTIKGAQILATIPGLDDIIPIIRNHHEQWDGGGYPDKLADERIPRLARLVAVVDSFDAMTTERPYRASMSLEQAFAQIALGAGSQFDPACVAAFLRARQRFEDLVQEPQALARTALFDGMAAGVQLEECALCV